MAVGAHQEVEATAQRQPADAGVPERPAGHGEPVRHGRRVHVVPDGAAAHADPPALGVHYDVAQVAQVDDRGVVRGRVTRDVVPAAADGDRQPFAPRPADGRGDLLGRGRADDHGRPPVDRPVEGRAGLVVVDIVGEDPAAGERRARLVRGHHRGRPSWSVAMDFSIRRWRVSSVFAPSIERTCQERLL